MVAGTVEHSPGVQACHMLMVSMLQFELAAYHLHIHYTTLCIEYIASAYTLHLHIHYISLCLECIARSFY